MLATNGSHENKPQIHGRQQDGEETIVALSSGALPCGVAVLRMSGPACRMALETLAGSVPEPRRASYRRIRGLAGETIDRGIVIFFPGPNSVTGEDLAEFHLHGGRAVVSACLEALTSLQGVRLAEAGEFTRRAFENGRIDLTEAEGLGDLLSAETEGQRRVALAQSGGALRTVYEGWMKRLTHARAMIEASFDFADEGDVGEGIADFVAADLHDLLNDMGTYLSGARRGEILREGYRVAIAGPPNAGKSSLMNALAQRDVAIVSDIPGTTRDVLEVTLDLGGLPVRFSDTAGLRETSDAIEAIGVERAHKAIEAADLVLLMDDGRQTHGGDPETSAMFHVKQRSSPSAGQEDGEQNYPLVLILRSKSDLIGTDQGGGAGQWDLALSSATGDGMEELISRIAALAGEAAGTASDTIPIQARHRDIIRDARSLLEDFFRAEDAPLEIRAELLRAANNRLSALTGRVGVEELLGVIFSQFCIGK